MSDPQGSPGESPPAPNTPKPRKWGALNDNPNAHWVKVRDLVGKTFHLVKVNQGNVRGKPSFIFEMDDAGLFSVSQEGSSIGERVQEQGKPPVGPDHAYTVDKVATDANPSGYALVLREL